MRDEGGGQVRLDLVDSQGIVGSVMVERGRLPWLAQHLLTIGLLNGRMALRIAQEGPKPVPGCYGSLYGLGYSAATGGANGADEDPV